MDQSLEYFIDRYSLFVFQNSEARISCERRRILHGSIISFGEFVRNGIYHRFSFLQDFLQIRQNIKFVM